MRRKNVFECARCGSLFEASERESRVLSGAGILFCSLSCFVDHVTSMRMEEPVADYMARRGVGLSYPAQADVGKVCYSPILGTSARSYFELIVLETLVLGYGFECYYEPHFLHIGDRLTYCPDIYMPAHGVWLEVKGVWRNGAKKKFRSAVEHLGEDRVLLVPDSYRRWFEAAAQSIRRARGGVM